MNVPMATAPSYAGSLRAMIANDSGGRGHKDERQEEHMGFMDKMKDAAKQAQGGASKMGEAAKEGMSPSTFGTARTSTGLDTRASRRRRS